MQQRMSKRVGANEHAPAGETGLRLPPERCGDRSTTAELNQLETITRQQLPNGSQVEFA